ncbi:hypothetical protein [Helicobacter trogontum]|nr:hypothetical protein [Helicobacter trogontum]MDY5185689.1 hypothetical protein [Helicobacter trogontum]
MAHYLIKEGFFYAGLAFYSAGNDEIPKDNMGSTKDFIERKIFQKII